MTRNLLHRLRIVAIGLGLCFAVSPAAALVKLSSSGICHAQNSPHYERTSNFRPFGTLQECLAHGRLPKSGGSKIEAAGQIDSPRFDISAEPESIYNRDAFGGWADDDRDCLNTRHEILAALSVAPVRYTASGCSVATGQWRDPYTGKTFRNARDLDIDHLVPLYYAWSRGADKWSQDEKRGFSNDPANLFAVEARENREKGAKGPTEWMPSDRSFHCQYILRFTRVVKSYRLHLSKYEDAEIAKMRRRLCG